MMENLLEIFTQDHLSISTISLVIIITLLFNLKNIIEFIESRKKIKISKLQEALSNECIKGLDRELLENELIKEHFKITLDLNIEKEFREAIIKTHKNMHGNVSFKHFQRALLLLDYDNGTFKVKIPIINKFAYYYNIFAGIFLIIFGFLIIIQNILHNTKNIFALLVSSIASLILFGIGFLIIFSIRDVISARIILKELKKLEQNE